MFSEAVTVSGKLFAFLPKCSYDFLNAYDTFKVFCGVVALATG